MGKFVTDRATEAILESVSTDRQPARLTPEDARGIAHYLDAKGLLSMEPTAPDEAGMWSVPNTDGTDRLLVANVAEQSNADVMLIDIVNGVSVPLTAAQAESLAVALASAALKTRAVEDDYQDRRAQ